MALLEIEDMGIAIGGRTPLAGISLEVPEGSALAVVGAAGSGKSMLALAVAGLLPGAAKVSGLMRFGGLAYPNSEAELAPFRGKRIGFLGPDAGVAMLERVLGKEPDLLVADEPGANLDVPGQRDLLEAIRAACRSRGTGLMYFTREFALAAAMAPEVAILERGRIVESGAPQALAEFPRQEATRRLATSNRPRTRTMMRQPIGEPLLEVSELRLGFRNPRSRLFEPRPPVVALDGIGFALRRGESVGLLGGRGSGKSSLLRLVAGLGRPDAGQIAWHGQGIGGEALGGGRSAVALVFPDPFAAFNPELPVGLSLTEPLRVEQQLLVDEQADRLVEAVRVVGLPPELLGRMPGELTAGALQRLALARALIGTPKLMLLDEPTAQLDSVERNAFIVLFNRVRSDFGLTVLVGSHDFEVIRQLTDRVLVLERGRIVEGGKPAELAETAEHPATRRLVLPRQPGALVVAADRPAETVAEAPAEPIPVAAAAVEVAPEAAVEPAEAAPAPVESPAEMAELSTVPTEIAAVAVEIAVVTVLPEPPEPPAEAVTPVIAAPPETATAEPPAAAAAPAPAPEVVPAPEAAELAPDSTDEGAEGRQGD